LSKDKTKKTKIGGQALIEGVMMKGEKKVAMACRLPNGTIDVEEWESKGLKWYNKAYLIRGVFNFFSSMIEGYKALMKSADKQLTEEDPEEYEKLSKFEKWLNDKLDKKAMNVLMILTVIVSLGFSLLLFMYLPVQVVNFIPKIDDTTFLRPLLEGIMKIVIFICYIWFTSIMNDMRRVYQYHGAEHKTIACFEAGEELSPENVMKHTRFHPRCGTSFIILVLIISILIFSVLTKSVTADITTFIGLNYELKWVQIFMRVVLKLVLLPVTMGVTYEVIRWTSNHDNVFTRVVSAPGLCLQRLTTREPDESQIEVAVTAFRAAGTPLSVTADASTADELPDSPTQTTN
jgi:uncharacterized protein YqhQ